MFSPRWTPVSFSVEYDVEARMRDGTALRADVYCPDGGGQTRRATPG